MQACTLAAFVLCTALGTEATAVANSPLHSRSVQLVILWPSKSRLITCGQGV
jgi:hypothetical protein